MTSPPSTSKDHAQTSLLVDIAHDHTRPRTRKCLTRGPADGGTPAGDQCATCPSSFWSSILL